MTLASLHGKVVLLTFLDDTCSVDCPLIAQEFRQAGQLLSADTAQVELVAINYNPVNTQVSYIQAFDRQEGLAGVPNWLYLTGTPAQLQQVWRHYDVPQAEILPAGSMIGHGDYAFVIDQSGHMRQELDFDTGPGTQATKSSFAARADRRRPAAAGALMRARPSGRRAGPGRRGAAGGVRQPGPRRPRSRGRSPAGRGAVPGHVHGHPGRHLGRRGDGRPGRPAQQLLAAVRPPGREQHAGSWPPRLGPPTTAAWSSADAGGSLITGFRPSQYLTYTPLTLTRNAGQAWSSAGPLDGALADVPDALAAAPGTGNLLALTRRRHGRAGRTRLHQLDDPGHAAVPRRDGRRPPLRAARPHRRRVRPAGDAPARRQLRPPGNRGHLRRHRRNLARSRARAARRPGPPARASAQADQNRQRHGRAARRGHRASRHPARRLVLRRRQPLGPIAPAPAERRGAELGLLRARRHGRDRAERQPRRDRGRPRSRVAGPARAAAGHRDAGRRSRGRIRRAGRPIAPR